MNKVIYFFQYNIKLIYYFSKVIFSYIQSFLYNYKYNILPNEFVYSIEGNEFNLRKSRDYAAAFDIVCHKKLILKPGVTKFPTGLRILLKDSNDMAFVESRSSIFKSGIIFQGLIDPYYNGNWNLCCINTNNEDYVIESGDRIAQILFTKFSERRPVYVNYELYEDMTSNKNRFYDGSFGSSGK